jgi:hypothetical protein
MPMFCFNIYNDDVTLDDEGAELADYHAAYAHAIKGALSLAADTVLRGQLGLSHRVEIVDGEQTVLGRVTFSEAVEVRS